MTMGRRFRIGPFDLLLILIATMNIAEKVKKTRKEEKTTSNLEDVITMDYR